MPGFKTIADGHILLTALTTKPKDPRAITVAELEAGKKISCHVLKTDYQLGVTGQGTFTETEICKTGEGQAPGAITREGSLTVPRYLDPETGQPDAEADFVYGMLKTPGTTLYLVEREGPVQSQKWAVGDTYDYYEVVTNAPQKPSDRFAGYQKRIIKLSVSEGIEDMKVVAGG